MYPFSYKALTRLWYAYIKFLKSPLHGRPTPPPGRQAACPNTPPPPPSDRGAGSPGLALSVEQKRTSFENNLKGNKSGHGKKKKKENVGNVVDKLGDSPKKENVV